jgi:hypothetical protein
MSRLRYASLALIVAAALLATGSGAFSSVDASRASTIEVASDGEAYLAIEKPEEQPEEPIELDNGVNSEENGTPGAGGGGQFEEAVTILTITNNFHSDIDVTASPGEDSTQGPPPKFNGHGLEVDQNGNEFDVTADIVCSSADETEDLEVVIEAHSDDGALSVETTEEVTIECTGESSNGHTTTETDSQEE